MMISILAILCTLALPERCVQEEIPICCALAGVADDPVRLPPPSRAQCESQGEGAIAEHMMQAGLIGKWRIASWHCEPAGQRGA